MISLEKLFGVTHRALIEKAKEIAKGLGYDNIYTEHLLAFNGHKYNVDVYAERSTDNKRLIIECGNLSGRLAKRLLAIDFLCDDFIWLPYYSSKLPDNNTLFDGYNEHISILLEKISSLNMEINKLKSDVSVLDDTKIKLTQSIEEINKKSDTIAAEKLCRIIETHGNNGTISRSGLLRYGHYESKELDEIIKRAIFNSRITEHFEDKKRYYSLISQEN